MWKSNSFKPSTVSSKQAIALQVLACVYCQPSKWSGSELSLRSFCHPNKSERICLSFKTALSSSRDAKLIQHTQKGRKFWFSHNINIGGMREKGCDQRDILICESVHQFWYFEVLKILNGSPCTMYVYAFNLKTKHCDLNTKHCIVSFFGGTNHPNKKDVDSLHKCLQCNVSLSKSPEHQEETIRPVIRLIVQLALVERFQK